MFALSALRVYLKVKLHTESFFVQQAEYNSVNQSHFAINIIPIRSRTDRDLKDACLDQDEVGGGAYSELSMNPRASESADLYTQLKEPQWLTYADYEIVYSGRPLNTNV